MNATWKERRARAGGRYGRGRRTHRQKLVEDLVLVEADRNAEARSGDHFGLVAEYDKTIDMLRTEILRQPSNDQGVL